MIAVLLIVIPLMSGLAAFFFKDEKTARSWALFSSIGYFRFYLGLTVFNKCYYLEFSANWMGSIDSSFSIKLDGMGQMLCLLTAIVSLGFMATWNSIIKNPIFFGLMLLTQAGLMGVFLAWTHCCFISFGNLR